jgi:2-polyprenyl-3-methyl-5-hydroxy-6-metoxy-1,4-benzoquinol methylase
MTTKTAEIDPSRLEAFVGQAVTDMAAAMSGVLINLGHKLGIYRAMAESGSIGVRDLAKKTGLRERYVKEWLHNHVAGGYVEYCGTTETYFLPPEHAAVLADPKSPFYLVPAFELVASMWLDEERVADAFKQGRGFGWHEHHHRLFHGTEAFFRTGYQANLTTSWIPALEGVEEKLKAGGKVLDVGCGHGASTIVMAKAYPKATFVGVDYHPESIEVARKRAQEAGVTDRVTFEVASAKDYSATGFDLICFFDCLHDMGDPAGAAARARKALAKGGTVLLVEPFANDSLAENKGPVARMYYAASTTLCVPNSLSQEVGAGLGAQAGEAKLREILKAGGFGTVRRAASTPVNLILEAKI